MSQISYGVSSAFDVIFPGPIIAERAPTTGDRGYELGQMWIDHTTNIIYILTSYVNDAAQWQSGVAGSGTFAAVTATAGDITASVGNLVATGGNLIIAAGTATVSSDITSTVGNIVASAGNISATLGSVSAGTTLLAGTTITSTNGDHVIGSTAASAVANNLDFKKSRTAGVITTGDALGHILFRGIGTGVTYTTGASITSTSSGTIGANRVAANLVFATHDDSASGANAITRMTIASTGEITVAAPDSGVGLTIVGGGETITLGDFTTTAGNVNVGNVAVATTAPFVNLKKSRAAGVITSGDLLGQINFQGIGTGTTYTTGASITATSSGTIGANRVASNLVFATHDDSASGANAITRMTIASTGGITIATPDSGVALTITAGGETITAGDLTLTNGDVVISTANKGVTLQGGLRVISRATTPNGVVTAPAGSLCLVANGSSTTTRMFINTDSGTTWTAVVTVA